MDKETEFLNSRAMLCSVLGITMLTASCGPAEETDRDQADMVQPAEPDTLLYSWMSDPAGEAPNILAVIDADPASATYGTILNTVAGGEVSGGAHHTNFTLPHSGQLFANDFAGDASYIFDTSDRLNPSLAGGFRHAGDLTFAHTFAELPNGNMLVVYQTSGENHNHPGGLAEYTMGGELVRTGFADPGDENLFMRPYSMVLVPELDRVVTTNTDMKDMGLGLHIQIWRLSDLTLLQTLPVPVPEGARDGIAGNPFEIALHPDGRTVLINTLFCGFYALTDVETDTPNLALVHDFDHPICFVPVRVGNYWVQTVIQAVDFDLSTGSGAVQVLDIADPAHPRLVSQLDMPVGMVPHWVSPDQSGTRIAMTGFGPNLGQRILMFNLDAETGELSFDPTFGPGDEFGPGVLTTNVTAPGGQVFAANPHGTVFWPPADASWQN